VTRLEKIGLIIGIPSGIATTLEYLEKINFIKFLRENAEWIPLAIKTLVIWFYENVVLLQVNIWLILLVIYAIAKGYGYFIKKKIEENSTPIDFYQSMSDNHKKIFNAIVSCHNIGRICEIIDIQSALANYRISKLEVGQILDQLIENDLIDAHNNFMAPISYSLTILGRDIAVELIKQSYDIK
jgi:hypothetical protein